MPRVLFNMTTKFCQSSLRSLVHPGSLPVQGLEEASSNRAWERGYFLPRMLYHIYHLNEVLRRSKDRKESKTKRNKKCTKQK